MIGYRIIFFQMNINHRVFLPKGNMGIKRFSQSLKKNLNAPRPSELVVAKSETLNNVTPRRLVKTRDPPMNNFLPRG